MVELLITVALISILLGFALPSLQRLGRNSEAISASNRIVTAVNFTRYAAISHAAVTTLCPSRNGKHCGGPWHGQLMVFIDRDGDAQPDGRDGIMHLIPPTPGDGTIKWRAFRNRQYLQMTGAGHTNFQNGNFVYCDASKDPRFSRQIVINIPGRARVVNKRNPDGHIVDRRGKLLRC